MRSRCWPAARTSSICAAAGRWRARLSSSASAQRRRPLRRRAAHLEDKLKQAQAKLQALTKGEGSANPAAPSAEQAREIDKFRADLVATRQQFRQAQASLREDIGRLKLILEFFDVALVPIVVVAAAIVMAALRRPRRRRISSAG